MAITKFTKAVLITGLIAGTLDAAAASIQYYINTGNNPARIFRSIATAVFGKDVMTKDLYSVAAWGLLFHYIIAMSFTLIFFLCYRPIRSWIKDGYVAGVVYALFIWFIMNLLVVPLVFGRDLGENVTMIFDKAHLKNSLIGAGILIIAIGLPVSLLADRYFKNNKYQMSNNKRNY